MEQSLEIIQADLAKLQQQTGIVVDKKPIAKGGFSFVFVGSKDKKTLAIKATCTKVTTSDEAQTKIKIWTKNDLTVTGNLKNKNCVRCLGIFEFPNSSMILQEYAPNKDMSHLTHLFYSCEIFKQVKVKPYKTENSELEKKFNDRYRWYFYMSESFIRYFFNQITTALFYLRKMSFLHRDIKLENLLLTKTFQVKLTDFALSTALPSAGVFELSSAGTSIYMPPECFDPDKKDVLAKEAFKIDYYALGCILHKMLFNENVVNVKDKETKRVDFKELSEKLETMQEKFVHYADTLKRTNEFTSKDVQRLLVKLLDKDITKRIDIPEIINNTWTILNEDVIRHIQDIYEYDPYKFLLELQKMDFIDYYKEKEKLYDLNDSENIDDIEYEIIHIKFNKNNKFPKRKNIKTFNMNNKLSIIR